MVEIGRFSTLVPWTFGDISLSQEWGHVLCYVAAPRLLTLFVLTPFDL